MPLETLDQAPTQLPHDGEVLSAEQAQWAEFAAQYGQLANDPNIHTGVADISRGLQQDALQKAGLPQEQSAIEDAVVFAHDRTERDQDLGERTITPAHHTSHIELARKVDPAIDARPAPQQDLEGEVLEIGNLAEEAVLAPETKSQPKGALHEGTTKSMNHNEAVSVHKERASETSRETLSAQEKQHKAKEWVESHVVTEENSSASDSPFAPAFVETKRTLRFGEDERVPDEYASEVALTLLGSEDHKTQALLRDNYDRFPTLDNSVAGKVMEGPYPADVIERSDKFPGISLDKNFADRMVDDGNAWAVVEHIDKFSNVPLDPSFADKLVSTGQAYVVVDNIEKFTDVQLDAKFVDLALAVPGNALAVVGSIDKFSGVEPNDGLAKRIIASGGVDALAFNLHSFSALSNDTAQAIAPKNLNRIAENRDKFPALTPDKLANMVADSGAELWGMENFTVEDQSAIALAKLDRDGSLDLRFFSTLNSQAAETLIAKGLGADVLGSSDKFLEFSPTLELATQIINATDGYPGSVVQNIGKFPVEVQGSIAQLVAERGYAASLGPFIRDGTCILDADLVSKIKAVEANYNSSDPIATYLENFPTTDHNALAKTFLRSDYGGDGPNLYQVKRLIQGLSELEGLDGEVANTLLVEGYQKEFLINLSHFNGLDKTLADSLIASGEGVAVIIHHEAFVDFSPTASQAIEMLEGSHDSHQLSQILHYMEADAQIAFDSALAEKMLEGGDAFLLTENTHLFRDLGPSVADKLLEVGGGYSVAQNLDMFTELSPEIANKLAGIGCLELVLNSKEKFPGLSEVEVAGEAIKGGHTYSVFTALEMLPDLAALEESNDPAVQRFAKFMQDKELVDVLGENGQLNILSKQFLQLYMDTESPDGVASTLKDLTKGNTALWRINQEYAKLLVGEVGDVGYLSTYKVDAIPLSLPRADLSTLSSEIPKPINFADMDEDTRRLVLNEEALQTHPDIAAMTEVAFTELNSETQDALLAYRLYESIALTRDGKARQVASERNKAFAEVGNYWHEGDLTHATPSVGNLRKILQTSMLCGETLGSSTASDSYPFNVDTVVVSQMVLEKTTHQERAHRLHNEGYGEIVMLLHRTPESTDFGRETQGGMVEDHRLVFGAVPATEISAIMLRGDSDELKADTIDAIVESGMYIPVVDHSGELALSYEQYQSRRADGNYINVEPRILDSSFKREGTQGGSNEGAMFVIPTAHGMEHHYVKFGDESAQKRDHLWTEVLADSIYRTVTPELVPDTEAVIVEGRLARSSKYLEISEGTAVTQEARNAGFIMDSFVGNWDAVFNEANLAMTTDGRAPRFDNGNSLDFRARGEKKDEGAFTGVVHEVEFGNNVGQLGTGMRQMYPGLTDEQVASQVKELRDRLPDSMIDGLVDGVRRSKADRDMLARTLKARKQYLVDKFLNTAA